MYIEFQKIISVNFFIFIQLNFCETRLGYINFIIGKLYISYNFNDCFIKFNKKGTSETLLIHEIGRSYRVTRAI